MGFKPPRVDVVRLKTKNDDDDDDDDDDDVQWFNAHLKADKSA